MIDTLLLIFGIILSVILVLSFIALLITMWLGVIDDLKERINEYKNKEEKYHECKK